MSSYLSIFQNEERRTNHAHLDEKRIFEISNSDTTEITTRKKFYTSCDMAIVFVEITFVYPCFVNGAYVL